MKVGAVVSVDAGNITQLCFELSQLHEIMSIECVGFNFKLDNGLTAPTALTRGNLILTNPPIHGQNIQGEDEDLPGVWYLDLLELTCNANQTLARIVLDTQPITSIVSASPHVLYSLSDKFLQEIWIVDPVVADD